MNSVVTRGLMNSIELGLVPDALTRLGIRRLLKQRLRDEMKSSGGNLLRSKEEFLRQMEDSPLALHTEEANAQHYELPPEFFEIVLGPRLKYSSAYYESGASDLAEAEVDMLQLTTEHANLQDGQRILELGCGWGSLTLWMATRYPNSEIQAVSNSVPQRRFIERRCQELGLENVRVITADMNRFQHTGADFDRVVSVEMFEHMRNWRELFRRISTWLTPNGELFFHVFCHREYLYPFETEGAHNWMGRHFFTGGLMPSRDLPMLLQEHLSVSDSWEIDGSNYGRTSMDWLRRLDSRRDEVKEILERVYGTRNAARWFNRWRVFFLSCAELFNANSGREWFVTHYRMSHSRHT